MTEPRVLLDTNICIYLIEGLSDVARQRAELMKRGEVVTSSICFAELMRGLDWSNEVAVRKIKALFTVVAIVDFDRNAALRYATLPFRRHSYDRLIAAHALALGVPLATSNEADFVDVPGLRIENWTLPL